MPNIDAAELPWLVDVNVFMTPITHTNWSTNVVNTAMIRNGSKNSSGAQNDMIAFDVGPLAAGTWTIEIMHITANNYGIFSVRLDDVEVGTIDCYGSNVYNVRGSVTGISVASTGKKRLKLVMATKNASSTAYVGQIQHIQLRRTA